MATTRKKGAAQLRLWLNDRRMNQREFGALAQIHWTHVNQLLSGRKLPGLVVAARIEGLTGVPAASWAPYKESVEDAERRLRRLQRRRQQKRAAAKRAASVSQSASASAPVTSPQTATDESAVAS